MSRLSGSIIPSDVPAFYASAEVQAPTVMLVQIKHESQFASRRDYLYYITHKINNIKGEDGRINLGYDSSGNLMANSVSPHAETFWDNVEPGIYPIIKALIDKRYLTYSSCEGHSIYARRFVGIAFWSEESREEFINSIKSLKLMGVICRKLQHVANMQYTEKSDGSIRANRIKNPNQSTNKNLISHMQDEIDGFNISFHRNYDSYYFLELIIYDVLPENKGLINRIKRLWLTYLKNTRWDLTTQKIAEHISSKKFAKYNM